MLTATMPNDTPIVVTDTKPKVKRTTSSDGKPKVKRTTSNDSNRSSKSNKSSSGKAGGASYRRTKTNPEGAHRHKKSSTPKMPKQSDLSPHEILQMLEIGASSGDGHLAEKYFDVVKKTEVALPPELESEEFAKAAEEAVAKKSASEDPFADMDKSAPARTSGGSGERRSRKDRSKRSSADKEKKTQRSLSPVRGVLGGLGLMRQATAPAPKTSSKDPAASKYKRQGTAPATPLSPTPTGWSRNHGGSPTSSGSKSRKPKVPKDPQDVLRMLEACAGQDEDLAHMMMQGLKNGPDKSSKKKKSRDSK